MAYYSNSSTPSEINWFIWSNSITHLLCNRLFCADLRDVHVYVYVSMCIYCDECMRNTAYAHIHVISFSLVGGAVLIFFNISMRRAQTQLLFNQQSQLRPAEATARRRRATRL